MVKQGDIIKTNFDPVIGHEQAGYRPALVVSNFSYSKATNTTYVCPITNTFRNSPLHVKLENHKTTGYIMCDQLRAIDLSNRNYTITDSVSPETLDEVVYIIHNSTSVLLCKKINYDFTYENHTGVESDETGADSDDS
ncbi:MAG: type II toxin-antitoxin system PemK/MazF family toxin [Ruminococcus sp.]|jgi:mRNA interferase MazF|nr:type II toxin-antitoxin system PemK/MazF family toxin [Ruminococcus sp.]